MMNIFATLLLPISLFNFFLAVYSLKYRKSAIAIYSFGFLLSISIYAFGYAQELSSPSLKGMLFWLHFEYLGIVYLPTFWVLLVAHFIGKEHLFSGWLSFVCFAFSTFMLGVIYTNQFHGGFYQSPYIYFNAPIPLLNYTKGFWYWFLQFYTLLSLTISIILLINGIFNNGKTYRRQAWVMLTGALVPIASYIVYIAGGSPYGIDLCPFSFSFVAIFFAIGLFVTRLLDFVPPPLEHVLQNLSVGIIIIDNKSRITHINKTIPDIFPYIRHSDIGENVHAKFINLPSVCLVISGQNNNSAETNIYVKNHLRHFLVSSSGFSDSKNRSLGKILVFNDITEHKKSELTLLEANATKDKFFSIIAHDLKNPFSALVNLSEILVTDPELSETDRGKITRSINYASHKAYDLLTDLLSWAMSQQDRISFEPCEIELNGFVSSVIDYVTPTAQNKNIKIITVIKAGTKIKADPDMLQTILRNLLSNAVKFTGNKGTVTIKAGQTTADIVISVSDTGIGMSDDDIKKIFRIDVSNTEIGASKEKGTGLGLIISNEFVKKHGGRMWVTSVLREGSTFSFSIPVNN